MRGLRYVPFYESELLLLFGMSIPYLDDEFEIEEYSDKFPDCIVKRNGKLVNVELEVNASSFFEHKHHLDDNLSKCDLLLCWKNDLTNDRMIMRGGKPYLRANSKEIEIIVFSTVARDLQKHKSIKLFEDVERQIVGRWNEEKFLKRLEGDLERLPERQALVRGLLGFCQNHPGYQVIFGEGGVEPTFDVRAKRFSKGDFLIVSSKGYVDINFKTMKTWALPADMEMEVRRILQETSRSWVRIHLKNQQELDRIKEVLNWLDKKLNSTI